MKKFMVVMLVLVISVVLVACSLPFAGEKADSSGAQETEATAPPVADSGEVSTGESSSGEGSSAGGAAAESAASFNVTGTLSHLDDFVLQPEDLPHSYRIPPGGESRYTNTSVVNELGELAAKKYIVATGRVDGWKISLERVRKADIAPARIASTMELFETNEGARLALTPDWFKAYKADYSKAELTWLDEGCNIGDECILYTYSLFDPTTNLTTTTYEVAFVYRNVLVWVMGSGLDVEMSADYIVNAAQAIYDRISRFE